jgi:hypothetical protein
MLRLNEFDQQDPWSQFLANSDWFIPSRLNIVIYSKPAQIVFQRDVLFDLSFNTEYKYIKKPKKSIDQTFHFLFCSWEVCAILHTYEQFHDYIVT